MALSSYLLLCNMDALLKLLKPAWHGGTAGCLYTIRLLHFVVEGLLGWGQLVVLGRELPLQLTVVASSSRVDSWHVLVRIDRVSMVARLKIKHAILGKVIVNGIFLAIIEALRSKTLQQDIFIIISWWACNRIVKVVILLLLEASVITRSNRFSCLIVSGRKCA